MARKMSPDGYQELGRRYYKLKQFDKAVEILTQGIEAMPTLGLYDHRAASYDKLEDFNAAVKDGREMIKLDKKEIKGYLRTAGVLEKMEKPDTALGIYKYGMKNIPTTDQNFKLLQQLHDKLTRKLSPPQAMDPFTMLPVELAEMVIDYLSFRQMVNCMRVSKGWSNYLAKLPCLWLHLDLSGARRPVRRSFVAQAVRRSQNRLTSVTVHRFDHMDVLKNIAKVCKNLRELKIITLPFAASGSLIEIAQSAVNLKKLVILPEVTPDTVTQIFQHRPDLEHIAYGGIRNSSNTTEWKGPFPALKSFSAEAVDKNQGVISAGLFDMVKQVPVLESLTLIKWVALDGLWPNLLSLSPPPPLREVILKDVKFLIFPWLPSTVQKLHIDLSGMGHLRPPSILLRTWLPELTDLRLKGYSDLDFQDLSALLDYRSNKDDPNAPPDISFVKAAKPLQSFALGGVLRDPGQGLFQGGGSVISGSLRTLTPALRYLDVAGLPCDDDEIEALLTHDLRLESIDLSSTAVTGASIKMLADKLPTLRNIKVDQCRKINGRDAIHYAERKGISVSYRLEEPKGERRIRY